MKESAFVQRLYKAFFDKLFAVIFFVLFWWLYLIIAIMVRVKLGSPVLFTQERPGKIDPKTGKEKIFLLRKFRTMTDERDTSGKLLPDEERLTAFGRFLRSTSLDELPELFNILKGEMSFVGPRPLLVRYLPYYTEEERHRHDVRPGLTGLAQINGRNFLKWEDRFALDIKYVKKVSFLLDLKIILGTVGKVFMRRDIAAGNENILKDLDVERKDGKS